MNKLIAIAIDEYKDPNIPNLNNCWNDINSLLQTLTSHYYEEPEIILFNKPEQTTLSYLHRELNQELRNTLKQDNILIMYAGHGEYNSDLGVNYWYCSDSKYDDPTTWFDIRNLLDFFRASAAQQIALISDSCFSGAIFENSRGGGVSALTKKRSRQALTSGGIETVSDGSAKNSPFNIALTTVLENFKDSTLTFGSLSEEVITLFSSNLKQTPQYGSLTQADHQGGTYIFPRKHQAETRIKDSITEMTLSLDIDPRVDIEATLKIPFFNKSEKTTNDFINNYVHQIGYSIINDVRRYITDDIDYCIERSHEFKFDLHVFYSVSRDDDKFLSVLIEVGQFFGTAYPNYWVETVNFAFNPIRKLEISDLVEGNVIKFLEDMVNLYADEDCKSCLLGYLNYNSLKDIEFIITEEKLILYFYKLLPHALKGAGLIEVPLNQVAKV